MDPFKKNPAFLRDFREGDAKALEAVYRAFVRPLKNFVGRGFAFKSAGRSFYFKGLWDESDLEDIVQETFRRAFGVKARAAFDGERPYKNYLFTIARNAVITDLTHRRRQIPVGDALMRDAPNDELSPLESWIVNHRSACEVASSSDEQLEGLEVYALVAAFLETLSADDGRFFRVRFLGQLSQESTAQNLGWNRSKVRKLEVRLRRAFLCHVKDSGYLETRAETHLVRRVDPHQQRDGRARVRAIWLHRTANADNEILVDAA